MPSHRHKSVRPRPHYLINAGLGLAVLLAFGISGTRLHSISSAATANPYGYADYCELENNTTVIYGWGADPNATSLSGPSVTINAGGEAITVPTNRAGYRDAPINSWIDTNRTGDPKPGTYGFRATLTGLYKGSRNIITGTVLNQGPGSSVILAINNSSYTDGDPGKPFFANDTIPDACLATPPPPPTQPAPTPSPTPAPTRQSGGSGPGSPAPAGQPDVTAANDADAAVTAGTLAASVAIQADGAKTVHINYGTSPIKLDQSTSDQPVAATDPTKVAITGLSPSIAYSYQVVRNYPDGKTTSSSIENFTTLAYVVAVHFVDDHTQGIQGIKTSISDHAHDIKTSNDEGTAQFTGIQEGLHTIRYAYRDLQKSRQITVSRDIVTPSQAEAARVITLDFTINIEKAIAEPSGSNKGLGIGAILAIVFLALVAVAAVVLMVRRRKKQRDDWYDNPPVDDYLPVMPPDAAAPPPRPAHTGESLKDLVLRSMAEEAKRKNDRK